MAQLGRARPRTILGKLADLAVLSANSLMVSDDAFRTIKSVLTMQGDRIVHLA